jgi:cytochrome c peroxidase
MYELKIGSLRSKVRGGALALLMVGAHVLAGQPGVFPPDRPPPPGALNLVKVPLPSNLSDFVINQKAAIVLGKALFWDQQVGSDGLACASCHFQAGADNRVKNALNPGLRNVDPAKQNIWNLTASNKNNRVGPPPGGGPNYTLKKADFPFHQLADPLDRNSAVLADTDDIAGSQGVFRADFNNINVGNQSKKAEICKAALSPTFSVHGTNTRAVEPRNTPTVINAIFNFRSFFDGRANNVFNGRNPFGPRDPSAGIDPLNSVLVVDGFGNLVPMAVTIADASLASQAVGPPGSNLEMSCNGRVFEEIGKKIMTAVVRPLNGQAVSVTDSVLGPYVNTSHTGSGGGGGNPQAGLNPTYTALVQQAFPSKFWSSTQLSGDGYKQIEKNFSLFFGLSIMLYESTLVSDNSPFDQYVNGNISAISTQAATGFQIFNGNGGCVFCHDGAEFTGAASPLKLLALNGALVEHMNMGDGTVALYDSGFYNIGVRAPGDDIGVGGLDPWNNPLSFTRQATNAVPFGSSAANLLNVLPDGFTVATCNFSINPCAPISNGDRDAIDGGFKVPSLRNIELTGPYFHNGGQSTLEAVIDFYNRGGDGIGPEPANTTGFGINPTNRAPAIFPLNLSSSDKAALVALLKSLTDDRVRWEKAPFDHPGIVIPNGHPTDENSVKKNSGGIYAIDDTITIPAVGAAGRAPLKLPALGPFDAGLK